MSPRLPALKPRKVAKVLRKVGFVIDHHSGGHAILYKEDYPFPVSIPWHNKDLKRGTLHKIIKDAGLTVEEFKKLL